MSTSHEGSAEHEELTETRPGKAPAGGGERRTGPRTRRREMLTTGLGVAAAAVGVGAVLDLSAGTAQASPPTKAGVFASSVAGTPAVSATGTNGADGVDASSDSGTGVKTSSGSGTGLVAASSSGLAGRFDGGVQVNGSLSSGAGTFASSGSTTVALSAQNDSGFAIRGISNTGVAGRFDGDVQVTGNLSVAGSKNFVQAHPADPGKEIVYVALEGGEAGTYVRGTGQIQDGKAVVALPEHFGLVTAADGLTVQLTPRSGWLQLYVAELDAAQLVVREAQDKSGLFDYLICGVRKGYEQHEVIRPKG